MSNLQTPTAIRDGPPAIERADAWFINDDDVPEYEYESDAVLAVAQYNFKMFYNLKSVPNVGVLAASSAGIAGWASCVLGSEAPTIAQEDYSSTKGKSEDESLDSGGMASSPARRRKGDDEESRELQLALLESLGVSVGKEAKRSLIQDMVNPTAKKHGEKEGEEDWSVEDDYLYEEEDEELETVSLESTACRQGDPSLKSGLSPLVAGLGISTYDESSNTDGSTGSFVIIPTRRAKSESPLDSSTSSEEEHSGETGLSPLTQCLNLDSSEEESQDSADSFVNISSQNTSNASSSSGDEWAVL